MRRLFLGCLAAAFLCVGPASAWHFHGLVGPAFAVGGEHGGAHLAATLSHGDRLVGGLQAGLVAELPRLAGSEERNPLESYRHAGAFLGRRFASSRMSVLAGLGAGWFQGVRRGRFLREYQQCDVSNSDGECPPSRVVTVRDYEEEAFATASLNPHLAVDWPLGGSFCLGLWGQAFLNPRQSLVSLALTLRFGR